MLPLLPSVAAVPPPPPPEAQAVPPLRGRGGVQEEGQPKRRDHQRLERAVGQRQVAGEGEEFVLNNFIKCHLWCKKIVFMSSSFSRFLLQLPQ